MDEKRKGHLVKRNEEVETVFTRKVWKKFC